MTPAPVPAKAAVGPALTEDPPYPWEGSVRGASSFPRHPQGPGHCLLSQALTCPHAEAEWLLLPTALSMCVRAADSPALPAGSPVRFAARLDAPMGARNASGMPLPESTIDTVAAILYEISLLVVLDSHNAARGISVPLSCTCVEHARGVASFLLSGGAAQAPPRYSHRHSTPLSHPLL